MHSCISQTGVLSNVGGEGRGSPVCSPFTYVYLAVATLAYLEQHRVTPSCPSQGKGDSTRSFSMTSFALRCCCLNNDLCNDRTICTRTIFAFVQLDLRSYTSNCGRTTRLLFAIVLFDPCYSYYSTECRLFVRGSGGSPCRVRWSLMAPVPMTVMVTVAVTVTVFMLQRPAAACSVPSAGSRSPV